MKYSEIYCQPRYAYWYEDYGVDPYAPRMPWVTATMTWRSVSWFILPIWKVLSWIAWQVYGQDAQKARGAVAKPERPWHAERRNGKITKVWDDVADLGEGGVRTEMYARGDEYSNDVYSQKDTYSRDTYSKEDRYSQKDTYAEDVPVASDARIPRPSWAPDLSMMDDEYL